MKPILLIVFVLLFGAETAWTQYESLDSVRQKRLAALPDDRTRVDKLVDWSYDEATTPAQALEWINLALREADCIGYAKGQGSCFLQLGHLAKSAGNYVTSETNYREALEIRKSIGELAPLASCYNMLGQLLKDQGKYDTAIALYQQGLNILKNQTHLYKAYLHNGLGAVYMLAHANTLALQQFELCRAEYEKLKANADTSPNTISLGLANVRMNFGNFLQENLDQYLQARDALLSSLAFFETFESGKTRENLGRCLILLGNNAYYSGDPEQAIDYYERGLQLKGHISVDKYNILLKNRGRMYLDLRKFPPALQDFRASLASFEKTGNSRELAAIRFELGNYYYEQDQLDSAIYHYQQALRHEHQDSLLLGRLLYFLADALAQQGNQQKAQTYTSQYIGVLNNLSAVETRSAFSQLIKHQLDKNRTLKWFKDREKATIRNYSIFGIATLFLLLLVAVLAAMVHRQKRRAAEQKEQLAIQKNLELLKEKELETLAASLKAREEMQRQIGKELHDGVGALLTTIKLYFPDEEEPNTGKQVKINRNHFKKANQILDQACEKVRNISHELRDMQLLKFGLKARLESYVKDIRTSGNLSIELITHGLQKRLDLDLELQCFSVIQELISNVIKHARASTASVQVSRFADRFNFIVEDDGIGFDDKMAMQKHGMGLYNLEARVHDMGGELLIDSQPGRGTSISVDIPLLATNT
ncbi:MAG: sensor histidine kinase [Saprospiraceae bacterium]